ncbi:UDP-N-acetylmuramoyl-L-alanine--D-glutamate ligase [Erythrobacter sp. 3-20A1M]|uniref:UDP-N-acetylmuramoyl-L-alanine--D-glutamate ligase n=1 Tax=Erythrobacter sp. 3-20A1M TaxID=2653850 RepID=UPI001BFC8625|nr:UDP-N-acetylmuramoyl-L-alanine--D-glutamate ligase [Erythrobacter sp. 3-20A1M]QWC56189.1 UDP-N-acetylmuramoyl-L-alanine--D-glutamate ligase [Erythrobacter sp. 3-20A1M]
MITNPTWSGKRFAVLGLARSGMATAEALLASGAEVLAWDRQDEPREKLAGRARIGDPLAEDLTGFDGVVVSPGVPLNTHPIGPRAHSFGVPVIGDIELFAQARPTLPPHKVVGITGTNGKSTTTALVHHILQTAGVPTRMGGNIGIPVLEGDPLPEGGVYVLELSSYQIDLTHTLDCDVAVLLNVTPDHLDRYESFEAYAASKARLFKMQTPTGLAVVEQAAESDLDVLDGAPDNLPIQFIDMVGLPANQSQWPSLQGPHNLQNAQAAVAVCRGLGIRDDQIVHGLRTFRGLPHRMEVVREHAGVIYLNDSKATNTASAAPALAAWPPDPDPRVHWIVGGLAKEDGLGECEQHLGNIAAAYTIGDSGPRFAELLEGRVPVNRCELLCEAVRRAVLNAKRGDVVLLSPACASFDQFRDYEQRGDHFRQLVDAILNDGGSGDHAA